MSSVLSNWFVVDCLLLSDYKIKQKAFLRAGILPCSKVVDLGVLVMFS